MNESVSPAGPLVLFSVAGSRWAVPAEAVDRVILAVEIAPRPGAPPVLLGTIDLAGEIAPVYDLSRAGGREIALEDMIVLVRTRTGPAGLWASDVQGAAPKMPDDPENGAHLLDPDEFLTAAEAEQLDQMDRTVARP